MSSLFFPLVDEVDWSDSFYPRVTLEKNSNRLRFRKLCQDMFRIGIMNARVIRFQ